MTITMFRRMLAEQLESASVTQAQDNGMSSTRDLADYRYNAGIAKGLLIAAIITHDYQKDDEDEIDG